MSKHTKRFVPIITVFILLATLFLPYYASAADTSDLGQLLDSFTEKSGSFSLNTASRFFIVAESEPDSELLQTVQLIQKQFAADALPSSTPLSIVWGEEDWTKSGDIVVKLDTALGEEAYKLDVSAAATVSSGSVDGLIYGLNMLHKHFRAGGTTIQCFTASDEPDTVQRAVSLDCGRKYYTKDWICNFIRQISWMGYNTLELHFSDDSGFRIDIWDDAYYKGDFQPANDFTWLCGSNYTSWTLPAYQDDADKGKYLTTAELIEILETAEEYHIDVIPAFDSPSHLDYTTWMYEQNYERNPSYSFYSTYDQKTYKASDVDGIINYTNSSGWSTDLNWPYYSAVNVKNAHAKAFIFELYIDIANFFKEYAGSTDFSIGADEVQLSTSNLESGYSYAWGFSDFVNYINELNKLLNGMDYTIRMYNDFMGSTSYNASNYDFADNIEILYWDSPHNPSSKTASNHTEPVSYFVDEGRILYNCIQTNTYYALRKTSSGSDARSVSNRQWTFYHSNEEDIYDEWYSADISEHGDYSEDVADVPAANLGGAYFLIWCDYACISTEAEIWNGCYDTSGSGEYYSLLDRMWSNTIKMWNWDINDTLTFSDFTALRGDFSSFPGLSDCTKAPAFPASTTATQAYLADHSELTAALANKVANRNYTPESYNAYLAAYEKATAVNADHGATAQELAAQIEALKAAEEALVEDAYTLTIACKTEITNASGSTTVHTIRSYEIEVEAGQENYGFYLDPLLGYEFDHTVGCNFTLVGEYDNCGYVSGIRSEDTQVEVWFTSTPDDDYLEALRTIHAEEPGSFTSSSWSVYSTALETARSFTVTAETIQSQIDALSYKLRMAQAALVTPSGSAEILKIEKLTETAQVGKLVGLKVTTTPNIGAISVDGEYLTVYSAKVQTLDDGTTVKIWLIGFAANEAGTFTYTLHADSVTEQVSITIS